MAQATREAHRACHGVGAVRCTAQASVTPEHRLPGPSGQLGNGSRPLDDAGPVRKYDHLPSRLSLLLPCPLGPKHKMTARHCYSTVIKNTDSGTD